MATLGNLVVNLSANSQRFSKGIGKAQQRLTKFVAGAKASMASVGGIVAKVGGAIGVGGLGFGIKLAADAESAQVAFATLLGSSERAKKALSDLQGFAASTPFELGDLRNASKLLLNAGVSTDELIGRMTMLGDIAAGTGKPINDFAQIYSKVKATGKVSLETLNQLAERGVPIYDALAKQLGVSREEMLKMISRGEVGFNDMHNSLAGMSEEGGTFAGGMKAQSTTLAGLFSTMKDNIGFALQAIAEQIIETFDFKGIMGQVISFAQSLTARIGDTASVFQTVAGYITGTIVPVFTTFGTIVGAVFTALQTYVMSYVGAVRAGFSSAAGGVISFGDGLGGLVNGFAAFGQMAVAAINGLLPYLAKAGEVVGGFVAVVIQGGAAIIKEVGPSLIQTFSVLVGWISDGATMFAGWAGSIIQAGASMLGLGDTTGYLSEAFGSVGAAVSTVTNFITDAFTVVRNAIAQAITFAVGIGTVAFENFGDIASFTANSIALFFVKAFERMKYMLTTVVPAAAAWLWENMGTLFTDGVNFAMTVFGNMLTNIKNAWTALWDWINGDSDTFDFEWKGLTDGFVAETKKFPEIAEREMSALEKTLTKNAEKSSKSIGESYNRNVTEPLAELAEMQAQAGMPTPPEPPQIPTAPTPPEPPPEPPAGPDATATGPDVIADTSRTGAASSKMAGIAQRGSAQAFSQIITAMQGGQSPQEKLAKQGNKSLDTIAKNTDPRNSGQGQPVVQVAGAQ